MWAQYVGPVLTGLATLITAVGGIVLARARQISADLANCQRDSTHREAQARQWAAEQHRWRVVAMRYVAQLERQLLQVTMSVPDRPDELLM